MSRRFAQLARGLTGLLILSCAAHAQSAPIGWTSRNERGASTYMPSDVPSGQSYVVVVLPSRTADVNNRETWMSAQVDADVASTGARVQQRGEIRASTPTLLSTSRMIRNANGAQFVALYFGVESSPGQIRLVRVLASSAEVLRRYQVPTSEILRGAGSENLPTRTRVSAPVAVGGSQSTTPAQTTPREATSAPVSRPVATVDDDVSQIPSALQVRTAAPRRSFIRAGGRLRVGTYAGQQVSSDTREVVGELTISLYANAEFRQTWTRSKQDPREDDFGYDPATGRIDLSWGSLMDIVNSRIDPDTDFAIMGVGADGTPMLYAENDRGFRTVITVMKYVGPNQIPSPSAQKAMVAAAEAEAERYKHVVPAGQGIQDAQIAAVYMHSEMHRTVGLSMQMGVWSTLSLYVLLNDGTIHDGMPVAPDEMDVITSRRREPQTWGRWRRQGNDVFVAWSVAPTQWKKLEGEQMVKSRSTDVLRGRFSGGESRASGDVGSYSLYGVTFGANNRFELDSRGGTGTGSFTQTTSGTSIQTTRDDNGSVTSASTPSAVVSSTSTNANAARTGTYRVNGWNIEMRFGNGRVVRQPFFFLDSEKDAIYWDGKVINFDTGR